MGQGLGNSRARVRGVWHFGQGVGLRCVEQGTIGARCRIGVGGIRCGKGWGLGSWNGQVRIFFNVQ